ncbi:hypothetical protein Pfo_017832 [Paulownia fortunei]|nr:hypothetical protein Pfo_017832 [Paulownia fortunei]
MEIVAAQHLQVQPFPPKAQCLMTTPLSFKLAPPLLLRITPTAFRLFATTSAAASPTTTTSDPEVVTIPVQILFPDPAHELKIGFECGVCTNNNIFLKSPKIRSEFLMEIVAAQHLQVQPFPPKAQCLMTTPLSFKLAPPFLLRITPTAFRLFATTSAAASPTTTTSDRKL